MMRLLIIGDVHGSMYDYRNCLEEHEGQYDKSVQVGDMGVGFVPNEYINSKTDPIKNRFIRGNHDNPNIMDQFPGYIPDATVEDNIFYMGGAWSIDYAYRTPGRDWWENEELSFEELYEAIDVYEKAKPDVVITHDCPSQFAELFLKDKRYNFPSSGKLYETRTQAALTEMFSIHKPSMWFFGHWHISWQANVDGCEARCVNINEGVITNV